MILPTDALAKILDLLPALEPENVPLRAALNRVLATPAIAQRDLPPFTASMMDGYALNGVEADPEAMFRIIGEAAAGHGFRGQVGAGECVRIFTGAPLPDGTNHVIKQEEATAKGALLTLSRNPNLRAFTRPPGADFAKGDSLSAPRVLTPEDLARLAAMNVAHVTVARRPVVAILPTGDELVMPGEAPRDDQIIASNGFALAARVEKSGGTARLLPIASDTATAVQAALALASDADLIVTTGGASVGAYDVMAGLDENMGVTRTFSGIAMRPGRQMSAGKIGDTAFLGLPGNPSAVMVLGRLFMAHAIRTMLGLEPQTLTVATLGQDLPENTGVETYQNACVTGDTITPLSGAEGAFLSPRSKVNALLMRPAGDAARRAGEMVVFLSIE